MAEKVPARSILKQQTTQSKPAVSDEQKAKAERDRKNLGIALHHANKIQSRKDIEASILSNIETLLEIPISGIPTAVEASQFVTYITSFQPSDFDSLVEERTIDGKCGYSLCANQPRSTTLGPSATWKLKGQGAEHYCSNACFKKALYVKTQLSTVPAWERQPGEQPQIALHEDDACLFRVADHRENIQPYSRSNDMDLAQERGEKPGAFRPNQVMTDNIVEKSSTPRQFTVTTNGTSASHDSIEGYVPAKASKQTNASFETLHPANMPEVNMKPGLPSRRTNNDEDESWDALFANLKKP